MTRILTLIGLILIPQLTHAQFLEPEEVLLRDGDLPHGSRAAERGDQQIQDNIARHPVITSPQPPPGEPAPETPAETDPELHGSPDEPIEEDADLEFTEEEEDPLADDSDLDPVTARLLRRLLNQQQTEAVTPTIADTDQQTLHSGALHSGADLAGTGPGTVAAAVTLMTAMGWTLWRAGRGKKLVRR